MRLLFEYHPGVEKRKEKAFRMISEGHTHADICLQLQVSHKTLTFWIKPGLPTGDPDLDQLSFVDELTERERRK